MTIHHAILLIFLSRCIYRNRDYFYLICYLLLILDFVFHYFIFETINFLFHFIALLYFNFQIINWFHLYFYYLIYIVLILIHFLNHLMF